MNLKEKIAQDLIDALKKGDVLRRSVLSMLQAAIKNKEIEKRKKDTGLSDEEVLEVIGSEIKKRKDAILEYEKAKRIESAEKEKREAEILGSYLPPQLSEEEVRIKVREAILKLGAADAKDKGRVLGFLMPQLKNKAEGGLVAKIVEEELSVKKS